MKDKKLVKLQESDPHTQQLRKQWNSNNLDKNVYTMENDILKRKIIKNGLLYTPIVVPDILKDCFLILAHDTSCHNGFQKDLCITQKQISLERHEKIGTSALHELPSVCKTQHQNATVKK